MVKVFLIHSGSDKRSGKVDEFKKELLEGDGAKHCEVLTLDDNTKQIWKPEAKNKIKQSQLVIIILGDDADAKVDTMGWEAKIAKKNNKAIMLYKINNEIEIPPYLMERSLFDRNSYKPIAKTKSIKDIRDRIIQFDNGEYDIFSETYHKKKDNREEIDHKEIIEQYKMYQKTSEDLVSRRQGVNQFYQSVNGALITFLGATAGFVEMPNKLWILAAVSVVGIILDYSWISILEAYGTLNASKMKVINLIEKELPIILYDVEWQVMSDKLNSKKYVSFTNSEKRIPIIFAGLYLTVIVAVLLFFLVNALR